MNQSNPQQDSSDETGGTYAIPKSSGNSGNRRRRGPLMVQRLRRRRALHQVHRLRRRSYATTTTSSSSSSEDEESAAGAVAMTVARSSNGKRLRRRALRARQTMPTREDSKWIWELQLDRLEAFLAALALVVATKVLVPNINFCALVGPLRLALYTYGLLVGCTLSTIWVMCCLAFELTHD